MKKIPKMISTKDLAYISDMFNWNMIIINKIDLFLESIENEILSERLIQTRLLHLNNANKLLSILKGAKE